MDAIISPLNAKNAARNINTARGLMRGPAWRDFVTINPSARNAVTEPRDKARCLRSNRRRRPAKSIRLSDISVSDTGSHRAGFA